MITKEKAKKSNKKENKDSSYHNKREKNLFNDKNEKNDLESGDNPEERALNLEKPLPGGDY